MALQFGIITTSTGLSNIVIQSISSKSSVDIAEARGIDGKVIEYKAYSQNHSVDIRALVNASDVITKAGQTISIGGKSYIVETTSQDENSTGWVEISITAKTADSAAITTYSQGA